MRQNSDSFDEEKNLNDSLIELKDLKKIEHQILLNEVDVVDMSYYELIRLIASKAFPLFLASVANVGCFTMIFFFVSRKTTDPFILGAVGLGNMTLNLFLRSFVLGFNNSLVTILSQAYGAKHFKTMGHAINRAKILWTLCMIPLLILLCFLRPILVCLGQEEQLAANTQYYVRIAMFAFIAQLYFDIYRKILNSMKLFHAHAPVPFITLALHF